MSRTRQGEYPLELSQDAHQQLIGYLGLLLPVLLLVFAALRPDPALRTWPPLDSVSAYYYSGAVAIFVGVLFGLGLFLMTYRGYSESWEDKWLARVGAVCAFFVAIFPTEAPADPLIPGWWVDVFKIVHYVAATLLFLIFILFSLWLFRRTDTPKGQPLLSEKKRSNVVYVVCGVVMVISVAWTGVAAWRETPIFLPEAITLWAFAVSWLVKGRAPQMILSAVKQVGEAVTDGGSDPS